MKEAIPVPLGRLIGIGAAGVILLLAGFLWRQAARPDRPEQRSTETSQQASETAQLPSEAQKERNIEIAIPEERVETPVPGESEKVELGKVRSNGMIRLAPIWAGRPTKPVVLGPPAGEEDDAPKTEKVRVSRVPPLIEPSPPSPNRIRAVASWEAGTPETLEKARELLMHPGQPSTLKLIAVEKMRGFRAEEGVPILIAFLESPASPGAAYTKPTAIKILADMKIPLADEALARLAVTTDEDRVRLAIATLGRRENR